MPPRPPPNSAYDLIPLLTSVFSADLLMIQLNNTRAKLYIFFCLSELNFLLLCPVLHAIQNGSTAERFVKMWIYISFNLRLDHLIFYVIGFFLNKHASPGQMRKSNVALLNCDMNLQLYI